MEPAIAQLNTLFPTHARTLAALRDPSYENAKAYRSILRTRIYSCVIEELPKDGPIGAKEVVKWTGLNEVKTMKNSVSRVKQAKKVLGFLRGLPEGNEENGNDILMLGLLLEGPLIPIPIEHAERDGDADHTAIDAMLLLAISRVDAINKRVKVLMG